jgi:uncharacterized repeat protein (TIGR03803 family)
VFIRRLAILFCLAASTTALPAQTFTYTELHPFNTTDGYVPANVIQASDGNLYGTTESGGSAADGNVFRSTLAGAVTSIYSFCAVIDTCPDGDFPQNSVIQATDGSLYGATLDGGAYGLGSIFKVSSAGVLTTVYSFCPNGAGCTDGSGPNGLVQGNDGNLYGTTQGGGAFDFGAIFKITPTAETTIYSFCTVSGSGHCADGQEPTGALLQGSDGNFYGITTHGGANEISSGGAGTVFKVTPAGVLTTLYSFCAQGGSNCTDGQSPGAALTEGSSGSFYGVTMAGGSSGGGTVYSITSDGTLSTVYNFCTVGLCTDGIGPYGTLFLGSDGNFYGVAGGGTNANGVFFQLTTGGTETVLYPFCSTGGSTCLDGENLQFGVVQGSDGSFYGTTTAGGTDGAGVLYKVAAAPAEKPPVQLTLSPASAVSGGQFTLTYLVSNAFSDTLKYCFAANTAATSTWSGVKAATTSGQPVTLNAPANAGTYNYTLTCGGQETGAAVLNVAKSATQTTLAAAPNPAQVGQSVTLSATVTKTTGAGKPGGSVTYYYGADSIGSGAVNGSGVATLTASTATIPPGYYPLTATYSGDGGDTASSSNRLTVALDKAATSTTLTASPNPVTPPAGVTLTATVKRTATGTSGNAAGTVTFYYNGASIGSGTLKNGVVALTAATGSVPPASYPVTAKYGGDASDIASTSSAVTVVVK